MGRWSSPWSPPQRFNAVLAVSSLGLCTATCLLQAVSNWWCLRRVGRSGQYPSKVKNLAVPAVAVTFKKLTPQQCAVLVRSGAPVFRYGVVVPIGFTVVSVCFFKQSATLPVCYLASLLPVQRHVARMLGGRCFFSRTFEVKVSQALRLRFPICPSINVPTFQVVLNRL